MTDHEHRATIVREEVWKKAPVPGVGAKKFVYPTCGGRDGCGAILMHDQWFTNPEVEALYESSRKHTA